MDIFDLCDNNKINDENDQEENIESGINALKQKAKDYQQYMLNALSENKKMLNELTILKNTETEKQLNVKNNEMLISEIKINLKIAQAKYEALVNVKDIQFQITSKEISELADINTTAATTLMKQLGLKLKLNHLEDDTWEVKYLFSNNKEITLHYNILEGRFSLESMMPTPIRFDLMKEFFSSTQDINGFLHTANEYFSQLQN